MFSRRSVADVARLLSELRVEYLVLTKHWCLTTARGGCALTEVWDIEEPQNVHRQEEELVDGYLLASSVVDPNTLNLDPDPGFWPYLDPDPGSS